jgi:hypothetical protein
MKINLFQITIATIIIFCLCFQSGLGQNSQQIREGNYYKAWVKPIDKSHQVKGCLSEIGDSMIIVTNLSNYKNKSIELKNIKSIKFRKKGKIGKGILFGALIGFSVGGILGLSEGDDEDCFIFCQTAEQKAGTYGILLAIPSAIIGGVIGSVRIKIPINGNSRNEKEKLLKYKLTY